MDIKGGHMKNIVKCFSLFTLRYELKIIAVLTVICFILKFCFKFGPGILDFFMFLFLAGTVIIIVCFVIDLLDINYFNDIDGNCYAYVRTGDFDIMIENLRTTTYNDGTPIPGINNLEKWDIDKNDIMCQLPYKNKASGVFYNFRAVNTGKLAPDGWHIPTDLDWKKIESIGMPTSLVNKEGGRDISFNFWLRLNINGGGYIVSRPPNLKNFFIGHSDIRYGCFWTSSPADAENSWIRIFHPIMRSGSIVKVDRVRCNNGCGLFVRCIRPTIKANNSKRSDSLK